MKRKKLEEKLGEMYLSEKWKPIMINGNTTKYFVSTLGRIRGPQKIMSPFELNKNKKEKSYLSIRFKVNGIRIGRLVHRLVAEAFIPNPENKPQVNHIDGNKQNNCVENLEWVTRVENMQHAVKNNLLRPRYGSTSPFAKHLEKDIHEVCKLLELGIHTVREIHELTGVSIRTINGIFRSNKWHQITSHYDIKKPVMRKPHRVITDEMNDSIYKIIHDGFYNVAEILDHLGWEHSGPNKQIIRARLRRYRASTTTESRIEKSEE